MIYRPAMRELIAVCELAHKQLEELSRKVALSNRDSAFSPQMRYFYYNFLKKCKIIPIRLCIWIFFCIFAC